MGMLTLNRMYMTPIWTVTFEATGTTYNVHESILKQSPVLAAMCKDGFLEATKQRIDLPEEEASIFHHVISYLYRGDIDSLEESNNDLNDDDHTDDNGENDDNDDESKDDSMDANMEDDSNDDNIEAIKNTLLAKAVELTKVYSLADKYLLDGLKSRVVASLEQLTDWKQHRREFVDVARTVYAWLPARDRIFRQFFNTTMTRLMPNMTFLDSQYLIELVEEGGLLARDMYEQMLGYRGLPTGMYGVMPEDWTAGPAVNYQRRTVPYPTRGM